MMKRRLTLLTGLALMTASHMGCASFIGPFSGAYVPEEELTTATTSTTQSDEKLAQAEISPTTQAEFDLNPESAAVWKATGGVQSVAEPVVPDDSAASVEDPFGEFDVDTEESGEAIPDFEDTETENPFAEMDRQGLLQVSHNAPSTLPGTLPGSTFRPAEPRLPTATTENPQAQVVAASPVVQAYPDEYIFDGGDRDHPVHYYGGSMQGLDTEDTVVEFKDHEGDNHVKASNRVAVYAPRFGAVRTVSGPDTGVKVDKAAGATDIAGLGKMHANRTLHGSIHQSGIDGLGTRRSASGVETAQPIHSAEQAEGIIQNAKVDQGVESRTSRGLGMLHASAIHELELVIQGVGKSNSTTGFGRAQASTQATQTYSTFRVQATLGMEKGGRPGKMHITKSASPLVAKAGDNVTFVIQFRNTGDLNVHDVRIIDNLTPRLTYVDGTGQINVGQDAGGDLTVVPNKEGSQTLIFELDEPLRGGQSGTITFKAKVL